MWTAFWQKKYVGKAAWLRGYLMYHLMSKGIIHREITITRLDDISALRHFFPLSAIFTKRISFFLHFYHHFTSRDLYAHTRPSKSGPEKKPVFLGVILSGSNSLTLLPKSFSVWATSALGSFIDGVAHIFRPSQWKSLTFDELRSSGGKALRGNNIQQLWNKRDAGFVSS